MSLQLISFDVTRLHFIPFNPTREHGKARATKGKKGGGCGTRNWVLALTRDTDREPTHARHETISGWTQPPTSDNIWAGMT
jgi:hypothetical protein